MKRIAIIIATLGLLAAASPAQATSSSFTATITANGVSLDASGSNCSYLPCTHKWVIDGVQVLGNNTRSYVTKMAFGCHTVEHTIAHRTLRAPAPYRYTSTKSVCVTMLAF
jgi:hypothetical protein